MPGEAFRTGRRGTRGVGRRRAAKQEKKRRLRFAPSAARRREEEKLPCPGASAKRRGVRSQRSRPLGERSERTFHLLQRFRLDLADALGRDAELVGEVVQRQGAA